jgi:hypothetical protein
MKYLLTKPFRAIWIVVAVVCTAVIFVFVFLYHFNYRQTRKTILNGVIMTNYRKKTLAANMWVDIKDFWKRGFR